MEAQDERRTTAAAGTSNQRAQPRFKLKVDIGVNSRTSGELKGHTVDISESGISAVLKIEVPVGEVVELKFTLPSGAVTIYAIVRQRNAFRYGFQFAETHPIIQAACRHLAVEQSLFGDV